MPSIFDTGRLCLEPDPELNADGSGCAAGWMLQPSDYGIRHTHGGSAGTFFAVVSIYPELDSAVAVALNVGPEGMPLAEGITEAVMRRLKTAVR